MQKHPIAARLAALYLALCLTACASRPQQDYEPVGRLSQVAVVRSSELTALQRVKSTEESVIEGAEVGGGSGMLAGSALGLVCGPFFWICSPALGGMGLIVGGVGGMVYGGVQGDFTSEQAERISRQLAALNQHRDLQQEMFEQLLGEVPATRQLPAETAPIQVSPIITLIEIDGDDDNRMHLHVKAMLLVSWQDAAGEMHLGKEDFQAKSESAPVDEWLALGGRRFDDFISHSVTQLAADMSHYIDEHAAPVQVP
ncbi:hypothetical protein E4634_20500 [Mangrovimicrobium sediminis]|uniref:Lipoprotein n=1 Tax=Mangrovimicrobium sediminis TaxID=2562682 RepID=A0A4Z0LUJ8_9GAMM|nr:hypothetical protein [Haliea sp. SAOS-164]TGD70982.1 hypothetical protein E4634_20500 [Haliea sp. SAOS-164]